MSFSSWWGKPEYNGIKVLVLVVLIVLFGYFIFNYMHTGSIIGTGQVAETTQPTSIPAASTLAATAITPTGATLNGSISATTAPNTPTSASFIYGTTTAYGSTAPITAMSGSVSATITGLACATAYHYRITAQNAIGTSGGGDMTFKTVACQSVVKSANSISASKVAL